MKFFQVEKNVCNNRHCFRDIAMDKWDSILIFNLNEMSKGHVFSVGNTEKGVNQYILAISNLLIFSKH